MSTYAFANTSAPLTPAPKWQRPARPRRIAIPEPTLSLPVAPPTPNGLEGSVTEPFPVFLDELPTPKEGGQHCALHCDHRTCHYIRYHGYKFWKFPLCTCATTDVVPPVPFPPRSGRLLRVAGIPTACDQALLHNHKGALHFDGTLRMEKRSNMKEEVKKHGEVAVSAYLIVAGTAVLAGVFSALV